MFCENFCHQWRRHLSIFPHFSLERIPLLMYKLKKYCNLKLILTFLESSEVQDFNSYPHCMPLCRVQCFPTCFFFAMYSWPGMNFYIFIQDNKLKKYNNVVATSNVINLIKTLLYPNLGISISLNYLSISQTIYIISCSLFCC